MTPTQAKANPSQILTANSSDDRNPTRPDPTRPDPTQPKPITAPAPTRPQPNPTTPNPNPMWQNNHFTMTQFIFNFHDGYFYI